MLGDNYAEEQDMNHLVVDLDEFTRSYQHPDQSQEPLPDEGLQKLLHDTQEGCSALMSHSPEDLATNFSIADKWASYMSLLPRYETVLGNTEDEESKSRAKSYDKKAAESVQAIRTVCSLLPAFAQSHKPEAQMAMSKSLCDYLHHNDDPDKDLTCACSTKPMKSFKSWKGHVSRLTAHFKRLPDEAKDTHGGQLAALMVEALGGDPNEEEGIPTRGCASRVSTWLEGQDMRRSEPTRSP